MPTYSASLQTLLDREPEPAGGTTGAEVDYEVGGTACRGYLARPAGDGPFPGVLVVHDWVGISDYVRMRADQLARLGYIAFAGDLYGMDVRPDQAEAPKVAGQYYGNPPLWRERIEGAFARLLEEGDVDRGRTAAIGYCFGGSSVLQLARTGADVGGVVSFHGGLQAGPEGEAERIRARVLVLHGANDPVTSHDDLIAFVAELRGAPSVDWQLDIYANAMHAFTLPDAAAPEQGAQYDPRAERRSWAAMKDFLAEVLA